MEVVDADGARTTNVYGELARLHETTTPSGLTQTYSYDQDGRVIAVADSSGGQVSYTYDARGRVLSESDALGNTLTYEYDELGRIVASSDAAGNTTTFTHDAEGRLLTSTDPRGAVTTRGYTTAGRLAWVEDPLGNKTSYDYDDSGRQVKITDALNGETTITYDDDGNVTSTTTPSLRTTEFEYDAAGRQTAVVDAGGERWETEYTARGEVAAQIDPTGARIEFEYDAAGNLTKVTDANLNETVYTYDVAGRRTSRLSAVGSLEQWHYDGAGRLVEQVDPLGRSTTFTHDEVGRLTSVSQPSGRYESTTYDVAGRPVERTWTRPPVSFADQFSGAAGSPLTETIPDEDPTGVGWTAVSGEWVTTGDGAVEPSDWLAAAVFDGDSADGTLSVEPEDESVAVIFRYRDPENFWLASAGTDQTDGLSIWRVDAVDGISEVAANPNAETGGTLLVELDGAQVTVVDTAADDQVTHVMDPDDADRSAVATRHGIVAMDSDLDAGRVASVGFEAASTDMVSVEYGYDAAGRMTEAADVITGATVSSSYDESGNPLAVTFPNGVTMTNEWDLAGRRTATSIPDATYQYDALGRLVTLHETEPQIFTYDSNGLLVGEYLAGLAERTYGYDDVGRLEDYSETSHGSSSEVLARQLGRDEAGRITTVTGTGGPHSLSYDDAGQLTSADLDGTQLAWSYDDAGRRTGEVRADGSTAVFAYDAANQIVTETVDSSQVWEYDYDADGRLVRRHLSDEAGSSGETNLRYDPLGRPEQVRTSTEAGDVTQLRSYNPSGEVAEVTIADGAVVEAHGLTWDTNRAIRQSAQLTSGDRTVEFLHAHRRLGAIDADAGTFAVYAYDEHGSTRAETQWEFDLGSGWINPTTGDDLVRAGAYDPFGNPDSAASPAGLAFGYRGELHIGDQIHLRHRDYAPSVGSFTTRDPLDGVDGTPTVTNPYHYTDNSPLNKVDPLGLRPGDECFELAHMDAYSTPWGLLDRDRAENVLLLKPLIEKWAQINGVDPFVVGVTVHHEGGNYLDPWRRSSAQLIDYSKVGVGATQGRSPSVGVAQVQIGTGKEILSSIYCETGLSDFEVAAALIESDEFSIAVASGLLGELTRTYPSAPKRGLFLAYAADRETNDVIDEFDWDLQELARSVAVDVYTGERGRIYRGTIEILLQREGHWVSSSNALREAGW